MTYRVKFTIAVHGDDDRRREMTHYFATEVEANAAFDVLRLIDQTSRVAVVHRLCVEEAIWQVRRGPAALPETEDNPHA
jgi:hypothetical protein